MNNNSNLLPYILLHEMEALMFSDICGVEIIVDDPDKIDQLRSIHGL